MPENRVRQNTYCKSNTNECNFFLRNEEESEEMKEFRKDLNNALRK